MVVLIEVSWSTFGLWALLLSILHLQRNVKKKFLPSVELALNKPSPSMWDMVLKAFKEALDKADNIYLRKAKSGWTAEIEIQLLKSIFKASTVQRRRMSMRWLFFESVPGFP